MGGGGDRMMEVGCGRRGRTEDRPTRHPHPRKRVSSFRAKSVWKETQPGTVEMDAVLKHFEKVGGG